MTRSLDDYEEEGKIFYQKAAEHPIAKKFWLTEVFELLQENFHLARKHLNFIACHYFYQPHQPLFGPSSGKALLRLAWKI